MGQRSLHRYVLPHPQSVNTRAYPTEVPEGDYLMLKNLDIAQNVGGFVTRRGYSRLTNQPGSASGLRGGVRWYYGSVNAQLVVAGDNGSVSSVYTWDGANMNSIISLLASGRGIWQFPYSQDLLFILNGSDTVRRWDGTTARVAGFPAPGSAPTVAAGAAGQLSGAYKYVVTFVYDGVAARESSASVASAVVNPSGQAVNISAIPTGGAGSGVTARNIYRTKNNGTLFYFLATISDNTTTTYTDNPVKATGTITTDTGANMTNGDTFTLNDGVHTPTVFEFNTGSAATGHVKVPFTAGDSANTIRDSIIGAVNGAGASLSITASNGGAALVNLTNNTPGTAGNKTIVKSSASLVFAVTGMSGGVAGMDQDLGTNQAPTDNGLPPTGAQFGLFWRGRFILANTPANPQRVYMSAVTNTEKSPGGGGLSLHGNGIEIFPLSHFIDVGDDNLPITGLAVIMDQLVVFKQQRIYNIQGTDAVDMEAWVAQGDTGCIAPKSIVNMGGSIFFLGRSDGVPTVYAYDGYKAEPVSNPIEPTLKANIANLGFTDSLSLEAQPCAFKYRGMYGLCYPTNVANQTAEIAILDTRPPQPRWQFWTVGGATGIPSAFIPWNGPGDSGQLYYSDYVFGAVYQVDVGSQDVAGASQANITATIKTKPMDLGHPGVWKQVHRVEVLGLAVKATTVEVDRFYNRDTAGILGATLTMAAPTDDILFKNLALATQDCASADDPGQSPEQGDLIQLAISLVSSSTAQAEISKIETIFQLEGEAEVRRPT